MHWRNISDLIPLDSLFAFNNNHPLTPRIELITNCSGTKGNIINLNCQVGMERYPDLIILKFMYPVLLIKRKINPEHLEPTLLARKLSIIGDEFDKELMNIKIFNMESCSQERLIDELPGVLINQSYEQGRLSIFNLMDWLRRILQN
ncbi:unnamed protein product [Schistosoma rodhaini]|uniref:Uncharacterized protein n=1 Tax=Schistosoma rodhaini TaxID=6188 RepID=A0AA85G858_9TREM|nr:unnamed protein product [Schistosoma rodhaini]CAH8608279.1 unnamed protein product [Schistosoma rodhaini]